MSSITQLSAQQLRQAANLKEKIAALEKELGHLIGSTVQINTATGPEKKFKMSAAAKAKMSAAAKLRWAKIKGKKSKGSPVPKKRKRMSSAAKAKLSAAAKLRWAKVKAAGRKRL